MTEAVTVVIVNYRTPDHVAHCLASLAAERQHLPRLSVMVVDGDSGDESVVRIAAMIARHGWEDWVRLLALPINGGFGYANNQALLTLAGEGRLADMILLLNPDTRVVPGALAKLVERLKANPRIGAAGARLEFEDGRLQGAAFRFPSPRGDFCRAARTGLFNRLLRQPQGVIHTDSALRVPWVTGAAVMLRRAALDEVGLFDDGFFLYFEETELMHRLMAAGWEIWHEPAARIIHYSGQSTKLRDTRTGRELPHRLPRYWYESRRRYMVRTHGAALAIGAGLAWIAGRLAWQVRCLLTGGVDDEPAHSSRDTLVIATWPRAHDRRTAAPRFGDAPGAPPAWMTWRR